VRPNIVKHIKGGSSLSNKSQRFNEKLKENPGPGAYIIENKENKALPIELRVNYNLNCRGNFNFLFSKMMPLN
jgi:hypothetical protein